VKIISPAMKFSERDCQIFWPYSVSQWGCCQTWLRVQLSSGSAVSQMTDRADRVANVGCKHVCSILQALAIFKSSMNCRTIQLMESYV